MTRRTLYTEACVGEPNVQLTGWKAVVVLVVVLVFGGYRWITARQSLDTEGRAALEEWVALEIQRGPLADSAMPLPERAQALLEAAEVRISDLSARGPLDDIVVKVRLESGPMLPDDAELTRYYRMSWSRATGWRHRADASALSWHLALF